ncbi:ribonuclease P protein component [Nonomuraea cavernae]|uniref:Ribonuclease P protein component n=1 Tax=Nonomuraea cavernae TaxID=2045107 RepID=A0A917YPN2_9ACTN|nr:ribonuclease P protein component [Nonomuraea cavernae]MCA2184122.1 ribonuclease P protein component [Nonomuraea cavernae]GGO62376.1 ribonuclease P protein component [Nonomuraea cavernae]
MLPRQTRMRRGKEFEAAIKRGKRAGRPAVVIHLTVSGDETPLIGFVVSRAVGGAVVRNKVKRRLRHLMRDRLDRLPRGSLLVVRANPPAAAARYEQLAAELDLALDRLLRRRESSMDGQR